MLDFIERVTRAEWISLGAVVIALAAARAAINSYRLNRDDKAIHGPTISWSYNHMSHGIEMGVYIDSGHRDLWRITNVEIVRPRDARLREVIVGPDDRGGQEVRGFGVLCASITLARPAHHFSFGLSSDRAATISVQLTSRAEPRLRRRLEITASTS